MLPVRNNEQNLESTDFGESPAKSTHALLAWGSLALAAAESLCVAAVGLSGIRVALGLTSLARSRSRRTGPRVSSQRAANTLPDSRRNRRLPYPFVALE